MPNESPGTPALGHKPWKKRRPEIEPPKVVVVSEGQTELDYMEGMSRGNQKNFIYEAYKREPFDIDLTDKSDMLNLLDAQVQYMRGHATPFCYATQMIKSLIEDSRKVDLNERNKKEIWSFRHKLVEAILDAGAVDSNGYVTKKTQEDADAACMGAIYGSLPRCIKLRNGVNGFYPGIVLCEKRRPFKSNDLALLMFDRDYWESPDENIPDEVISKQSHNSYLEIVKRCLDMNYTPVLSTPLFEFWLLMHHKDDIGDVKKYKMDLLSSRDKIERKLRDLEGYKDNGKRLSEERKRFYVKTFPEAVEVSKILETDPLELIFKSGTNVGVVLMGLMDQRR